MKITSFSKRDFLSSLTSLAVCTTTRLDARQNQSAAPTDPYPGMKKVLAIRDVHTGYQHDSVSHALAIIERLGRESGLFITYIRTDTQLITKGEIYGLGKYAALPSARARPSDEFRRQSNSTHQLRLA